MAIVNFLVGRDLTQSSCLHENYLHTTVSVCTLQTDFGYLRNVDQLVA